MTGMLTEEEFDKWIAALRSGEYKQGFGSLSSTYGEYCCLGVLNVVLGLDSDDIDTHYPASQNKMSSTLEADCIEMNDSWRLNFDEIADKLEKRKDEFVQP